MKRNLIQSGVVVCALAVLAPVGAVRANINFVNYGSASGDLIQLNSIGLSRGTDNYSYAYGELITPTLSAINTPSSTSPILLYPDPLGANRDQVLSDPYINTGFLDHGEGNGNLALPSAEYIKLSFPSPIYNHEGPDLIMTGIGFNFDFGPFTSSRTYFSFNGTDSFLVNREADLQLSPIDQIPMYAYDGITSPGQLVSQTPRLVGYIGNPPTAIPTPVIHALDLSDYGVAANASISHLWLQHDASSSWDLMPTMFAGLPAIPEPATGGLMLLGFVAIARRKRRR